MGIAKEVNVLVPAGSAKKMKYFISICLSYAAKSEGLVYIARAALKPGALRLRPTGCSEARNGPASKSARLDCHEPKHPPEVLSGGREEKKKEKKTLLPNRAVL